MADELAERIRRTYEAMNRLDFDAALEELDPEIEWHDPPEMPDRRPPLHGREALKRAWLEYFEPFDEVEFVIGEMARSGDRTFLELTISATGAASRAPVEMTWYQVGVIGPDGLTLRLENFLDRDRARESAGLA